MNVDAIVLGTGGVGSAALFHLARRGLRVLGLDRFPAGHNRGSSHGESRVIRRSYFEHPDYVPLLTRAFQLWDELSEQSGRPLLHRSGILYFGAALGAVLQGIQHSAACHNLSLDELSIAEAAERFPMFSAAADSTALFESDAGYLLVEDCVNAHLQQAIRQGALHHHGETIRSWSATHDGVCVVTDRQRYEAARLIVTAGSWTSELLADLQLPLRIIRKHMHWHAVRDDRCQASRGCPCYFIESQGGYFYGCPAIGRDGFKIAEHSGGTEIQDPLHDPPAPESQDTRRIETFRSQHLPGISPKKIRHERCFYTLTPDEHFIIDRHPQQTAVAFAAGLSGHGFKFTAVLGELLADLVTETTPAHDITFLSRNRPALAD